jgi:LacI family transcriptional regulator of maltose regulon
VIYLASDTRTATLPEKIRHCPLPLVVVSVAAG